MINQDKVELQERIKNKEKKKHFSKENVRENSKKFIEII